MSRQIKISGDTSELRKSLIDISKLLKNDLGKSKIELFSPETKKLLKGEAVAQAEALKKQIDAIKNSTKKHADAMKDVVKGSKEELRIKEKILKAQQHISKLEGERQRMGQFQEQIGGKGFLGGLKQGFGKIPLMGRLGGLAGMGALGGAGLLLGGGALAAGAYGISRVMAARETYGSGVDARVRLRGRGVTDMNPSDTKGMYAAGLNSLTLRQSRLRDMDVFGAGGATQKSVIQRAQFERNFGIEEGTLSGIGSQFRSSMGGGGASQTLMKLQASLIASGVSDAIGPYLETAAAMLTELNERGFTMDESVTSLFNSMLKLGMGEGRIQQLSMGADAGIRGSSGEANAFFQNVFNKAGIGGGTIGGAQAAMRMGGLFGVDLNKYKAMGSTDRKAMEVLGIGGSNHMQNVAGNTLGQLDQLFGSEAEINKQLGSKDKSTQQGGAMRRLSRLRYMMSAFGLKDEGQAAEVEGLLKKAQKASPEEQKKIMRKVQDIKESTPELENLKKINSSNEGIYQLLQNEKQTMEDAIGEATAGHFNKINELLRSIDGAILALAKFITGYETPEERAAALQQEQADLTKRGEQASKRFLQTGMMYGPGDMKSITQGLDWDKQMAFGKEVKKKKEAEEKRGFFRNRAYEQVYNSKEFEHIRRGIEGEERRRLREQGNGRSTSIHSPVPSASAAPMSSPASGPSDKSTAILSKILEASKVTAKNSKDKGTLKPGTGNTTGQ